MLQGYALRNYRAHCLTLLVLCLACAAENRPPAFPPVPETYEEAVAQAAVELSPEEREILRGLRKDELVSFHHGWAISIREKYGLADQNWKLLVSCAEKAGLSSIGPDACAMMIIEGVWNSVRTGR